MRRALTGVIKKAETKPGEPRLIGSSTEPVPESLGAPGGEPAARVLKQDDTHALIEVMCPCGKTTQLECEYPTSET